MIEIASLGNGGEGLNFLSGTGLATYRSDHSSSCHCSLVSQMTTLHDKRHDEEKNEVQLSYTEGH